MTHRLLRVLVALVLGTAVATSAAACSGASDAPAHLSPAAFGQRASQSGAVLLDVRTPDEYAAGHLRGAVNVDVEAADFTARLAELDKGATYAVYCRSGNRSQAAMSAMADAGFTDLADLAGGINAWVQAGGEVVTD